MDTNIVTGSTTYPYYVIQNISATSADSIAKGDSIYLKTPTNSTTNIGIIIPGQGLKKDSFLVLNNTTVTGGYTVPFASILTLYNKTADTLKSAPFINNTQYCWYAYAQTVKAGPGNPAIASVTYGFDTARVWINKSTSGIDEIVIEEALNIKTYPNPAVNELSFDYNFNSNDDATVRILDANGRTVLVKNIENKNSGVQKIDLDITTIPNGMYFVHFKVGEKAVLSKFTVLK
jgi:hypothetical protein